MGYITETDVDEYQPTNFTKSLSLPIIGDGYIAMFAPSPMFSLIFISMVADMLYRISCTAHGQIKFHEFSRKRGWEKEPTDATDTSLMYSYNMNKDMFAWQQSLGCKWICPMQCHQSDKVHELI